MRLAGTAVVRKWQDKHLHLLRCVSNPGPCPRVGRPMHHYTCGAFRQLPIDIAIDPQSDYPGLRAITGGFNDRTFRRHPSHEASFDGRHIGNRAYPGPTSQALVPHSHGHGFDNFGNSGADEYPLRRTRSRRASTGSALGRGNTAFIGAREMNRRSYREASALPDHHRRGSRTTIANARDTDPNLALVSLARPGGEHSDGRDAIAGTQAGFSRTGYREPYGAREGARPSGEFHFTRQTATINARVDTTRMSYRRETGGHQGARHHSAHDWE